MSYADGIVKSVKGIVHWNRSKFEKDAELLQSAEQDISSGVLEDAWCELCPEQQLEQLKCQELCSGQAELDEDPCEVIPDLNDDKKRHFVLEQQNNSLSRDEA